MTELVTEESLPWGKLPHPTPYNMSQSADRG